MSNQSVTTKQLYSKFFNKYGTYLSGDSLVTACMSAMVEPKLDDRAKRRFARVPIADPNLVLHYIQTHLKLVVDNEKEIYTYMVESCPELGSSEYSCDMDWKVISWICWRDYLRHEGLNYFPKTPLSPAEVLEAINYI